MIFTNNNNEYYNESSIIDNIESIEPDTDNLMEASLQIAYESTLNYNAIMKAVSIEEVNYYNNTGEEYFLTESGIKGFFSKIKEFFIKLLQKIKGLFTKFIALIDSYVKSDKDFINKYKKTLNSRINQIEKMEYKGYKFTVNESNTAASIVETARKNIMTEINSKFGGSGDGFLTYENFEANIKSATNNANDASNKVSNIDMDDLTDTLRAKAIGSNGSFTASEFSKELFSKFRNGESIKEKIKIDLTSIIKHLEASDKLKSDANKAYKTNEKYFKNAINWCIKMENKISSNINKETPEAGYENYKDAHVGSKVITFIGKYNTALKNGSNILGIVNGAVLTALKDYSRQCKSICVKALTLKPNNESYNYYEEYNNKGLLENVKLI